MLRGETKLYLREPPTHMPEISSSKCQTVRAIGNIQTAPEKSVSISRRCASRPGKLFAARMDRGGARKAAGKPEKVVST